MSAAALAWLQQRFQGQVLDGAATDDLIKGDARADAAARLAVYADAYRLRLLEVLGNDYPALKQLVGAGHFDLLGRAYIEGHPSLTPSVRWFGRFLPEFLGQLPDLAAPAAVELALFEWKQGETFDAPDAAALNLAVMAAVPPEAWPDMRLLLHPALRRLDLWWNAPALFQAHQAGQTLPQPVRGERQKAWLLWRDAALDIRWRSLEADEAAALDAALDGRGFGELCELLCQWHEPDQAALQAAGMLKRWVVDGLVTELEGIG